jgi:hypothetical protein
VESKRTNPSPPLLKPTPPPVYDPMITEVTLEPQIVRNVDIAVSAEDDSKNITDCPELMEATPLSATEAADEKLLSSIFQPVIDTSDSP